jgi:hypothetical protein
VGTTIHPDMGITKVHNTILCESYFITKEGVSYRLFVHNTFCKNPFANDCTVVGGVRACICCMWCGWSYFLWWTLQTRGLLLPSAAAILCTLFLASSITLSMRTSIGVRALTAVEQRNQICLVTGKVWWIICGMGFYIMFCIKAMCFRRISIGTATHEMHACHFLSRVIRLHYKTTKWIFRWNECHNTINCYLSVHKYCIYWVQSQNRCKGNVDKCISSNILGYIQMRNSFKSQQALISGRMLTGSFFSSFNWVLYPFEVL